MTNGGGPSHGQEKGKKAAARKTKGKEPKGSAKRKRLLPPGLAKEKAD